MTPSPNYGSQTVCRPMLHHVPDAPPGATLTSCPYCGKGCWKLAIEPDPLPPGVACACTNCAFARMSRQREMDAARFAKESAT